MDVMEKFATDIDRFFARGKTGFTRVVLTTGDAMMAETRANEDGVGMAPEMTLGRRQIFEAARGVSAADAAARMTMCPL